ncbi:MAG: hypothetical protein OEN55_08510, partial [Alphaproteobacteria bacterium]|nr:hypothetical protein [Alphaproteobacteria bacterium]
RAALEAAATAVLARAAAVYPEGYATLSPAPLCEAPEEVGLRALSRLLTCIAGHDYGPRLERLQRLYGWFAQGQSAGTGRTLAGCRIIRRGERFLICREAAAVQDPVATLDGVVWDGRFRLAADGRVPNGSRVGRLGRKGWEKLVRECPEVRKTDLPAAVRLSLPAIWTLDEVTAVPHLCHQWDRETSMARPVDKITFCPARPLSAALFDSSAGFP